MADHGRALGRLAVSLVSRKVPRLRGGLRRLYLKRRTGMVPGSEKWRIMFIIYSEKHSQLMEIFNVRGCIFAVLGILSCMSTAVDVPTGYWKADGVIMIKAVSIPAMM